MRSPRAVDPLHAARQHRRTPCRAPLKMCASAPPPTSSSRAAMPAASSAWRASAHRQVAAPEPVRDVLLAHRRLQAAALARPRPWRPPRAGRRSPRRAGPCRGCAPRPRRCRRPATTFARDAAVRWCRRSRSSRRRCARAAASRSRRAAAAIALRPSSGAMPACAACPRNSSEIVFWPGAAITIAAERPGVVVDEADCASAAASWSNALAPAGRPPPAPSARARCRRAGRRRRARGGRRRACRRRSPCCRRRGSCRSAFTT